MARHNLTRLHRWNKNSILTILSILKKRGWKQLKDKQFIRNERIAFIWVNIGCIAAFAALMVWKYCPALQVFHAPCSIHEFFHLYCPGCGGTRAVYEFLNFHWIRSFFTHPFVLFVAVILADYYIGAVITLIRNNGKRYYYLRTWFCYVALGIVILHTILRNVLLVYFHYDYIGDLLPYWL